MAFAGVEDSIGGDGCNLMLKRDLTKQLGHYRRIAHVAGSEFGCTYFQRFLVDPNIGLTPDTSLHTAVRTSIPFALNLIPVLSTDRYKGPPEAR